MFHSSVA